MPSRRWPLHPQPREWEGLETYVRRIAAAYGVSTSTFLRHALGLAGSGARVLDDMPDAALARLSAGTGVPVERLRAMRTGATLARVNERIRGWLLTEEGREALEQLRVSVVRMIRLAEADNRDRGRCHAISE